MAQEQFKQLKIILSLIFSAIPISVMSIVTEISNPKGSEATFLLLCLMSFGFIGAYQIKHLDK